MAGQPPPVPAGGGRRHIVIYGPRNELDDMAVLDFQIGTWCMGIDRETAHDSGSTRPPAAAGRTDPDLLCRRIRCRHRSDRGVPPSLPGDPAPICATRPRSGHRRIRLVGRDLSRHRDPGHPRGRAGSVRLFDRPGHGSRPARRSRRGRMGRAPRHDPDPGASTRDSDVRPARRPRRAMPRRDRGCGRPARRSIGADRSASSCATSARSWSAPPWLSSSSRASALVCGTPARPPGERGIRHRQPTAIGR